MDINCLLVLTDNIGILYWITFENNNKTNLQQRQKNTDNHDLCLAFVSVKDLSISLRVEAGLH